MKEINRLDLDEHIRNARLMDDDFMTVVLYDNIPLVQYILRIILSKNDLVVTEMTGQMNIPELRGKPGRFDVRAKDSTGKLYDIEVQRKDTSDLPKRARYYSSLIDVHELKPGDNYSALSETYVIFITEKDTFRDGEELHVFERLEESTGIHLNDGAHIIFVNGAYQGDTPVGRLMHDFRMSDPDMMFSELLARDTRYHKNDEEGRVKYMNIYEIGREDGIAEGKAEGIAQGIAEGIAQGKAEGKAEGMNEGMDIVLKLFAILEKNGRLDDYSKAMKDRSYLEKLIKEYGLQ